MNQAEPNHIPKSNANSAVSPLLVVDGLTVQLGSKTILKNLCANIPRGRISALIGLNGSGKTTFLKALLKEVPYTGKVQWRCGHDHSQPYPHLIGYVPQRLQFDVNQPLTVVELIALGLQSKPMFLGISKATRERILKLLTRVHAENLLDVPVGGLSGGQLQRVLLAMALEPAPELLLLDEPAQGIDFRSQNDFYDLIAQVNRETNITMILVSHELSVVSKYAHRVFCMQDGAILCEGSGEEIITGEMIKQIFGADAGVYAHRH
ncbi:MAG: metal ABC transporter ATP-binding protein [Planctomycetia bacterium]|nr:metal ABC transporter ATP-binding protein [Planctomycetia bacterium]